MKNTTSREAIIVLPDCSGFTEFVYKTKMYTGQYIVRELLTELIHSSNSSFCISEIENHPILFYKYVKRPSYKKTMESLLDMLKAFESKISILSASLNIKIEFSLKLMVHYGAFTKYQLKNYSKLYGSTIVEAQKLLKNRYAEHPCCILLSNSFLKSSQTPMSEITANSKVFPEMGAILYI